MASEVIELYQRLDDAQLCTEPPKRPRRRRRSLQLQDLPSEVVVRILNFTCQDPVDVVTISLVCMEFRAMTTNEALWQRVCLNRFGFVNPDTVQRSGSWMTVMRNKALIENSPWTVKPKQHAMVLQNSLLGVTSLAVTDKHVICGGGAFDEPFDMCSVYVERTVNIYDRKTFEPRQSLQSRLGTVFGVEAHEGYLMACGGGGKTRLWKWDEDRNMYEYRRSFKGHTRAIFCCKFDKRTVVTGSRDGVVKVWDFRSSTELYSFKAHSAAVHSMDWDRRNVVTASRDRVTRYWHLETGQCLTEMTSKNWSLSAKMSGDLVVTGGEGKVRLWDIRAGTVVRKFSCNTAFPPSWITSVQFDDNKIAGGSFNRCAYIWDLGSARIINRWVAHEDKVTAVHFEGTEMYTASRDRTVKRWNFDTEPILPEAPVSKRHGNSGCAIM